MGLFDNLLPEGFFDFIPGIGENRDENNNTARNIAIKTAQFITLGPTGFLVSSAISRLVGNIDVNQVGTNFLNTVNNFIDRNNTNPNFSNLVNSVKTNVTNFINSNEITTRFSPTNVTNFLNENLINNPNVLNTFSDVVNRAAIGSQIGRFVDADAADNLIELTLEDVNWEGGLRALDGSDRILGTNGPDVANGNMGNDTLIGGDGNDFLRGGKNEDLLDGGVGDDILNGNLGDDTCRGGLGDDLIRGGQGNDLLYGDAGRDILIGDVGSDFLFGGADADDFVLRSDLAGTNAATADRILDFNAAEGDRVKLVNAIDINQIQLGALDVNQDGIGDTAIIDSNNRVLGVVMNVDVSAFSIAESILVVGAQDSTINAIG